MARSAVLSGRTLADLMRNVFVMCLMIFIGYLVGFRVQTGLLGLLAGMAVMLLFGFSLTWIFAIIGLSVTNAETAQVRQPLSFAPPVGDRPGPSGQRTGRVEVGPDLVHHAIRHEVHVHVDQAG